MSRFNKPLPTELEAAHVRIKELETKLRRAVERATMISCSLKSITATATAIEALR